MPIQTKTLDNRVKVEGKDATNRFPDERRNFIRDICIEISSSQKYFWLKETVDLTIPATKTDWIDLPESFHREVSVFLNGRFFEFLSEDDYAMDNYSYTTNNPAGFYRIRWNETTGFFQICFINGPDAGTVVKALIKKYLKQPEDFPDFMEEVLVKGALARFLAMQEGDDLELAIDTRSEYLRLAIQQEDKTGNNAVVTQPRRVKTNSELYDREMNNRYGR